MRKPFILLAFAALCVGIPLYGQGEPPRPSLPRGADANDWEAYFDEGEQRFQDLPVQARDYFYWASRLDPSRAEPSSRAGPRSTPTHTGGGSSTWRQTGSSWRARRSSPTIR